MSKRQNQILELAVQVKKSKVRQQVSQSTQEPRGRTLAELPRGARQQQGQNSGQSQFSDFNRSGG
jgi:hypothetical protein